MTTDDAMRVASWRYPAQWSVYDLHSPADVLAQLDRHWSVTDAEENLVGFFCVGAAARVSGLDADPAILDLGVGMHPRLVGRGRGRTFGVVVLDHVHRCFPGRPLRAAIRSWNARSRRLATGLGFVDVGEHGAAGGERPGHYRVLLAVEPPRSFVAARSGTWLFGRRVMLREFDATDEQSVHAYASSPAVCEFTEWGPNSVADTREFLVDAVAHRWQATRSEFALAAVHVELGTVIGSGAIRVASARLRRGDLGYVINPDYWSQGYATEVARSLVRFGFEHLRLRRIEATCDPLNHASARVLSKAGLRYEGESSSHRLVRRSGRHSSLHAIVDDDFRSLHCQPG